MANIIRFPIERTRSVCFTEHLPIFLPLTWLQFAMSSHYCLCWASASLDCMGVACGYSVRSLVVQRGGASKHRT